MGLIDKDKKGAEDALGEAKDVVGDVANQGLEAERRTDQASAGLKKVGENTRDIK